MASGIQPSSFFCSGNRMLNVAALEHLRPAVSAHFCLTPSVGSLSAKNFANCCDGPLFNVTSSSADSNTLSCLAYCQVDPSRAYPSPNNPDGHSDYKMCLTQNGEDRSDFEILCIWAEGERHGLVGESSDLRKRAPEENGPAHEERRQATDTTITDLATATPVPHNPFSMFQPSTLSATDTAAATTMTASDSSTTNSSGASARSTEHSSSTATRSSSRATVTTLVGTGSSTATSASSTTASASATATKVSAGVSGKRGAGWWAVGALLLLAVLAA